MEAANGLDAVLWARQQKPDLIILDLAMPLLDGFRVAREVGKALPAVPILMHTLYWSPRVVVEAMKVGVRKTIPKSDSVSLITAVRELIADLESAAEKQLPAQTPNPVPQIEAAQQVEQETNGGKEKGADGKKDPGGFETLAS